MFGINFSKYGINSGLFLIIILLLSLVLCSCLGGNCFNILEGYTSPEIIPTKYTFSTITPTNTTHTSQTANINGSKLNILDSNFNILYTLNGLTNTSTGPISKNNCNAPDCQTCQRTYNYTTGKDTNNPYGTQCSWNTSTTNSKGKCELTKSNTTATTCPASTATTSLNYVNDDNTITAKITNNSTDYTLTVTYTNPNYVETYLAPAPPKTSSTGVNVNYIWPYNFPLDYTDSDGNKLTLMYNNTKKHYFIKVTDLTNGISYYNYNNAKDPNSLTTYTFTDNNGDTAVIINNNGQYEVKIIDTTNNTKIYKTTITTTSSNGSTVSNTSYSTYNHNTKSNIPLIYYAPNGNKLELIYNNKHTYYIKETDPVNGTSYFNSVNATNPNSLTTYTFTDNSGDKAIIINNNGQYKIKVIDSTNNIVWYTTTVPTISTNSTMYNNSTNNNTQTPYTSSSTANTTSNSSSSANTTSNSSNYDYSSSEPQGVSKSNIPAGDEDLYMLKSQIVPPVCPACPGCGNLSSSSSSSSGDKCQPCPACARCKKPNFECKKVPNYKSEDTSFLPQPVMSTGYSTYGMGQ